MSKFIRDTKSIEGCVRSFSNLKYKSGFQSLLLIEIFLFSLKITSLHCWFCWSQYKSTVHLYRPLIPVWFQYHTHTSQVHSVLLIMVPSRKEGISRWQDLEVLCNQNTKDYQVSGYRDSTLSMTITRLLKTQTVAGTISGWWGVVEEYQSWSNPCPAGWRGCRRAT